MKTIENAKKDIAKLEEKIEQRLEKLENLAGMQEAARREYAEAELDGQPSAKLLQEMEKLNTSRAAEESVINVARERIAEKRAEIADLQQAQRIERAAEIDEMARVKSQELAAATWAVLDLMTEVNGLASEAFQLDRQHGVDAYARVLTFCGNDSTRRTIHKILENLKAYWPAAYEKNARIPGEM
jgi:chromosome segregation ATPase